MRKRNDGVPSIGYRALALVLVAVILVGAVFGSAILDVPGVAMSAKNSSVDEPITNHGGTDRTARSTTTKADGNTISSHVLLAGTRNATRVYVIRSGRPGPTALVIGGMHGDERSGYLTAQAVANWTIDAGTLVVIPRANRPAIRRGTRKAFGTDLNDQFPAETEPKTELARAIWGTVERYDPDVVIDLHSSSGIYKVHEDRVGQAIFPTVTGTAVADATAAVEYVNARHVPESRPLYEFKRGNALTGVGHSLVRRVAGETNASGFIVEATEYRTDLETRVRWTKAIVRFLLARHGMVQYPTGAITAGNGTTTGVSS